MSDNKLRFTKIYQTHPTQIYRVGSCVVLITVWGTFPTLSLRCFLSSGTSTSIIRSVGTRCTYRLHPISSESEATLPPPDLGSRPVSVSLSHLCRKKPTSARISFMCSKRASEISPKWSTTARFVEFGILGPGFDYFLVTLILSSCLPSCSVYLAQTGEERAKPPRPLLIH